MAVLYRSSRAQLCLGCVRQLVGGDLSQSWFPFYRQLRGKKKTAKRPTTIKVRLLEDVRGYGKKGSITPVAPGKMRNSWFPRQKAEYVTISTLLGLKPQSLEATRDFMFGMEKKVEPTPKEEEKEVVLQSQTKILPVKLLPPQRATEIMEMSLPSHLIFYRTPISGLVEEVSEPPPTSRPRKAVSLVAAELDAASEALPQPPKPQLTTIFGSVSLADVADSIKAVLGETTEGARVVLAAEDIRFIEKEQAEGSGAGETGIEGDRLKALGDFQVEARVKGGEPVVRIVSVRAQEV